MNRKIKKVLCGSIFAGIMCLGAISPMTAATLTRTKSAAVSTSIGSGAVYVTAQYYTTGNTRWNMSPTAYGTANIGPLKSVFANVTNVSVNGEQFRCRGNLSITLTNYATGTGHADFVFNRSGNSIN